SKQQIERLLKTVAISVDQSLEVDTKHSRKVLRSLLQKLLKQSLELRPCHVKANTGFELHTGNPKEPSRVIRNLQRKIDIGEGPGKPGRQHANNRVALVRHP